MKLAEKKQKMKSELEELKPKIIKVLKENGVLKAGIFGSYARGEQKKKSDVDILVEIKKDVSLFGFVHIKIELEEALNKKVDLVEYSTIKPLIRDRILNEEIRVL